MQRRIAAGTRLVRPFTGLRLLQPAVCNPGWLPDRPVPARRDLLVAKRQVEIDSRDGGTVERSAADSRQLSPDDAALWSREPRWDKGLFLRPSNGPHFAAAAAAAEEPVAAVGFESRHARAGRHVEPLQDFAGLRIDATH